MALGPPKMTPHLQGRHAGWEMAQRTFPCPGLAQGQRPWVTLAKNTHDVSCVAGVLGPDCGGRRLGVVAEGREEMASREEGNVWDGHARGGHAF